ncbi:MAG: HAD family hydrolase [Alphaproteobacteria bacterium]|nr:HAD family hydrolase [Alphaproteobacteria bacterium]
MTRKNYLFWDWNCTLLNDAETILACVNYSLSQWRTVPVTMDQFREIQSTSLPELYRLAGVPDEFLDDAVRLERDIFHDRYETLADAVPLRAGAAELLRSLKASDAANVIVSNHIADQIARLLKAHNIDGYFDDLLAFPSRNLQFREKTKSQRLRDYINDNAVDPHRAVIVGDTTEEIEVARQFGFDSIAITGGLASVDRLRAAGPDHLVHSLDEIASILKSKGFVG